MPGPSPRVRGSLADSHGHRRERGSIPACAGKPTESQRGEDSGGVHPRVCGEAVDISVLGIHHQGPSPRVRGSPRRRSSRSTSAGSIPACAGKPALLQSGADAGKVHPRVCGEAGLARAPATCRPGPSPRVRGSHQEHPAGCGALGSIPACAGKPQRLDCLPVDAEVHPRVCGEAILPDTAAPLTAGPSPRVRGSLEQVALAAPEKGSIPACAGKPGAGPAPAGLRRVHPRVCGEATASAFSTSFEGGPSPRVRGSRAPLRWSPGPAGSIPACAGKPSPV